MVLLQRTTVPITVCILSGCILQDFHYRGSWWDCSAGSCSLYRRTGLGLEAQRYYAQGPLRDASLHDAPMCFNGLANRTHQAEIAGQANREVEGRCSRAGAKACTKELVPPLRLYSPDRRRCLAVAEGSSGECTAMDTVAQPVQRKNAKKRTKHN